MLTCQKCATASIADDISREYLQTILEREYPLRESTDYNDPDRVEKIKAIHGTRSKLRY